MSVTFFRSVSVARPNFIMKLFVLFSLLAVVMAAPPPLPNNNAEIIRYDNDYGLGNYRFYYEQTDGTQHEQQGEIRNEGRDDAYLVVKGFYSWVGPDGLTYIVEYTADENGYKPQIKQPPGGAVPLDVLNSLLG